MGTNTFAPTGFVFSRNRRTNSPTFQANKYKIKAGFASKIGIGDLVSTQTGGNAGYIGPTGNAPGANGILGIFMGVLPYFDLTQQAQAYGLNGSYVANTNSQADIDCLVVDDPDAVWRIQVQGGPWAQSWRGENIQLLANSNGAPNASGISTAALDGTTVAVTNTLPFRIQELVGVSGGPQDPANTNPWIEVCINFGFSEQQSATGL